MKSTFAILFVLFCVTALRADRPTVPPATAEGVGGPVPKGLTWLAGQQTADGDWSGNGGQFPTALTGLAGTALFMEGSTTAEGKYARHLRRAVDWQLKQARPSGLILSNHPSEQVRYMLGHGFAMLFLACAHAGEEDRDRRAAIQKVLKEAVRFAADAQTSRGGWGYVSAKDGNDFDEGNATVTVLQGLFAARAAGVAVPPEVLRKAAKYHRQATNEQGGLMYSLAATGGCPGKAGRPIVTAGAVACALMAGGKRPELFPKWVRFSAANQRPEFGKGESYFLLQHFYFARVAYALGEDGHRKLDPAAKDSELVRWGDYRKALYGSLRAAQAADGSWPDAYVGRVFSTSLALFILQLDDGNLGMFARESGVEK